MVNTLRELALQGHSVRPLARRLVGHFSLPQWVIFSSALTHETPWPPRNDEVARPIPSAYHPSCTPSTDLGKVN